MDLQEKRNKLALDTLKEAETLLKDVFEIRSKDSRFELFFTSISGKSNIQLKLKVCAASIYSGALTIIPDDTSNELVFRFREFPLLFLHQISFLSSRLYREVSYLSNHFGNFNLSLLDKFISDANNINCVFYDLKFTNIDITQYLIDPPEKLNVRLQYDDFKFQIKINGFDNQPEITLHNINDFEKFMEIEKKLRRVSKTLRFLSSDVQTWQ